MSGVVEIHVHTNTHTHTQHFLQVLGLVKKSGQRIRQLFIQLNTRLNKSVDEKSRMGVKGQGSEGVQKI